MADDRAAESVTNLLTQRGSSILTVVEHEAQGRLATVRLGIPDGPWVVDLLFASSGIESEIVAQAEMIEVSKGLRLPVARTGHLLALKLFAQDDKTRPQDSVDIRALLVEADGEDFELARHGVSLIESRGFARGRDLSNALEALLAI